MDGISLGIGVNECRDAEKRFELSNLVLIYVNEWVVVAGKREIFHEIIDKMTQQTATH